MKMAIPFPESIPIYLKAEAIDLVAWAQLFKASLA